jgi:EAL domain-containing protein (putative c-di-GMP-specific phosphodiesterase class I)
LIAEGIENKEEAELLSQHAVDYAQGYFFAKPAVFDDQLLSSIR